MGILKAIKMELNDCAPALISEVQIGYDPVEIFKDADFIIFLGGFPRKPGMERKDLLDKNNSIFVT